MENPPSFCRYPLVVVGAGAAGLFLAHCLAGRRSVLLLDSGPGHGFIANDPRNAVHTDGSYTNGQSGRARGLGGTTNLWGGQMLPFSPHDLTAQHGWPFVFDELLQHYEAVSQILLHETMSYGEVAAQRTGRPLPALNNQALEIHFSKWLSNPRFRQTLLPKITALVSIKSDCTVTAIEPLSSGGYQLHCLDGLGAISLIQASQLVIATGTIEVVRLLMFSRDQFGLPVSNALGQGFMDHVSLDVCELQPSRRFRLQQWFNTRIADHGLRYSVRLSAAAGFLCEAPFLNASAMVIVRSPRNILQKSFNAFSAALSALLGRFIYKPFGPIMLNVMVEQASMIDRCLIRLREDQFPLVRWRPELDEAVSAHALATVVVNALYEEGWLCSLPKIPSPKSLLADLRDVCHPMGGAAMHLTPALRVVSSDLELIGCPGLYVASAAVFPSGSHSNPTMTLLALTHRLADYLLLP